MQLPRRDVLKILAGIPIAIGLPALGPVRLFAGDGDGDGAAACPSDGAAAADPAAATADAIRAAVAAAREAGQPALLIATPGESWEADPYARRQRIARRLAAIIDARDLETQLLVAQLAIVVATSDALRAAGVVPKVASDAATGPGSPIWIACDARGEPRRVRGALDEAEADATALTASLRDELLGERRERLAARRDAELERLGAARADVERAIAALGDASFDAREAASKTLRARRARIIATLAAAAFDAEDFEVRARCADVARGDGRPQPLGTAWGEFVGGCGRSEPYDETILMVKCGMARVTEPARIYLRILGDS